MFRFSAKYRVLLPLLIIVVLLTACGSPSRLNLKSNYSQQDIFNDQLFGQPVQVPLLDDVFALTAEQKQHFLNKFHSKEYRDLSDSERVFAYLQEHLEHFNFHSETLNASDAMALKAGNCMSLALLTKAVSQLTHVGISYELARTPPVFQRENNFELSSQHVRSVVYNKTTKSTKQFVKPNDKVKIDYFSTAGSRTLRKVKKAEFHSLFYSNRAAEAMLRDEYALAYWLTKEALRHKEDNLIAINILGVLYDRMGQQQYAEKTYLYGLSLGGDQLELLNNYHHLLLAANRTDEAQNIATILSSYDDPDPFKWLDLADKQLAEGHYRKAIGFYEKAAEKADYLHQPYAGLARANYMLGRNNQAIKAIEKALENAHTPKSVSIYQAKYELMKSKSYIN
jgi:Tfp pilus assembly protein PilF